MLKIERDALDRHIEEKAESQAGRARPGVVLDQTRNQAKEFLREVGYSELQKKTARSCPHPNPPPLSQGSGQEAIRYFQC
jgi:hypothetical protein